MCKALGEKVPKKVTQEKEKKGVTASKKKSTIFFFGVPLRNLQWRIICGRGFFHFRRAAYFSTLKSKSGNLLAKAAALRINLNLDGTPIVSKSHTHPSHS